MRWRYSAICSLCSPMPRIIVSLCTYSFGLSSVLLVANPNLMRFLASIFCLASDILALLLSYSSLIIDCLLPLRPLSSMMLSSLIESGTSSIISSAIDSAGLSLTVRFLGYCFLVACETAPTAGTRPLDFRAFTGLDELLELGRSSSIVVLSLGTDSSKSSG